MAHAERTDVGVIGGGLGGLLAATALAKAGRRVVLLERSSRLGGRAISQRLDSGHVFNLGPHALYLGGPAVAWLEQLGVKPAGGVARGSGSTMLEGGQLHTMPTGPVSLLTSGLLRGAGRLEFARLLTRAPRMTASPSQTVEEWLEAEVRHPEVRGVVRALLRLATYSCESDALSASVAVGQLRLALKGNLYADGGWQVTVDALARMAEASGVALRTGAAVRAVEADGSGVVVRTSDGAILEATAALLVVPPKEAVALLSGAARDELAASVQRLRPVRAACLDLALSGLPRPNHLFTLGVDQPLYGSVHSAYGRLAPKGGAMVQLAKYLRGGEDGAPALTELEALMDLWQPGWRERVVERRFLPSMTVSWALPTADGNGLEGRPSGRLASAPGLLLAGDWVGPRGWLLDAVAASAAAAVDAILAQRRPGEAAA
ncbi:MAG: FAD-dependent oxidoreductase [Myxococcaceae bacterium]